ncbi:TIGR01621 family pseudouridine synthase [Pelagibaculum spongiae]|uniref:TIGR01621 family pseudouridine synthase n=1 Tax=Pelagibaculum spongiae TaxID=2080658 RepID=A0A2V1H204_9GAMM|nr:TIGR01621 family pseudouridine synthase [Pelagibaculum spongiae]PVZ70472.1 TIGR01621 family pseudouridine synthase [Pelagibaculum spongiae]
MPQLIFQHDDFYLFHKPHNLSFHQDGDVSGMCQLVNQLTNEALLPVHRLDRMTSGLVLFARNKTAAAALSKGFAERTVKKCYLAISDKKPKKKQGLVKGDMAAGRRGDYKLLRAQDNPAITRFESSSIDEGTRLYLLKPETGKTHQLRVMMKSIGAPILGDNRYYPQTEQSAPTTPTDRGYLHAWMLQFEFASQPWQFFCRPLAGQKFSTETSIQKIDSWQEQLAEANARIF